MDKYIVAKVAQRIPVLNIVTGAALVASLLFSTANTVKVVSR